jgi:hypothetical protein
MMAIWLVPLAYVVVYRVLAQLATNAVVAIDASVYSQGLGLVIGTACAIASALACVHVHLRGAGPLPVGRAFVMAGIAMPILVAVHAFTMGTVAFTNFVTQTPLNAAIRYAIVFFALPIVAATWRPRLPAHDSAAAVADAAPARPSSPGLVILRVFIALVSVAGFLAWGVAFAFIYGMGGFGTGHRDSGVILLLGSPLAVFAVTFVASLGIFRPSVLAVVRLTVAVGMAPFVIYLGVNGIAGIAAAAVVIGFVAMFWTMCRRLETRA